MPIKVLADKVLAFDRGERNHDGQLVKVKTKIGFCELPDWVEQTDLFKAASKDGSLKAFTSSGESEAVLKEQEKLAAIKAEIAAMEEKRDLLSATSDSTVGKTGVPSDSSGKKHDKSKSVNAPDLKKDSKVTEDK